MKLPSNISKVTHASAHFDYSLPPDIKATPNINTSGPRNFAVSSPQSKLIKKTLGGS